MIPMIPPEIVRRANICLVDEEHDEPMTRSVARQTTETRLAAALKALKCPGPTVSLLKAQSVLNAGGAKFRLQPGDNPKPTSVTLIAELADAQGLHIYLGNLPDKPTIFFDRSDPQATALLFASVIEAAMAVQERIDTYPDADSKPPAWTTVLEDCAKAILHDLSQSDSFILLRPRSPFSTLSTAIVENGMMSVEAHPSDTWDGTIRPSFDVGFNHGVTSSEIRFSGKFIHVPQAKDPMELLRVIAQLEAQRKSPWWR